jgi:hypothetical protein
MFQKQGQAREKAEKIRPRVNGCCQEMIQKKHKRKEINLRRNVLQTLGNKIQSPTWSPIVLRGKSLWLGANHNR